MKTNLIWYSLGHAALILAYIALVAGGMFYAEAIFGSVEETFLIPVGMLMLLVLSAAVMGTLIFARPVLMYLDGQKKEAVQFLGYIIGWLLVLTIIVFGVLFASK